jgi:hypothetical protein
VTSPPTPKPLQPVEYKGEPLDPARGPGLGCFWLQIGVLVFLIVLTPLSVSWAWPPVVSAILLFAVILLLLFTGQTMIFLLRLVAAGRSEGRRRPLASPTPTVGELEDDTPAPDAAGSAAADVPGDDVPGVRE